VSGEEKLQSLVAELRILEGYLNEVNARESALANAMIERRAALEALRSLDEDNDSELLVPIGGRLFINSRASPPEKLVVSIGANVAVEKTREDANAFVDNRMKDLEKAISETGFQKNNLRSRIDAANAIVRTMIVNQRKA